VPSLPEQELLPGWGAALAGAYFSFALKSIWMTVISVSTSTCCNSDLERGGRKRYAAAASSCTAFPKK
jgi:hypothetical protein